MAPFFEGREVKPYGEFVRAADLVVGRVYFHVTFKDEDLVVPKLEAWIFIGRDLAQQRRGLYFQDAGSYFAGQRYDAVRWDDADPPSDDRPVTWRGTECEFHVMPDGEYAHVCEFEQALDQLLACSLRRKAWDGEIRLIKDR